MALSQQHSTTDSLHHTDVVGFGVDHHADLREENRGHVGGTLQQVQHEDIDVEVQLDHRSQTGFLLVLERGSRSAVEHGETIDLIRLDDQTTMPPNVTAQDVGDISG